MAEPGGHVLVVDDNVINRKQLARLLTDQGYGVTLAEDGTRAVGLLAADGGAAYDVILLDILMPGMDGYQVLAHVKSQANLRHIPVIMISALEEMDSVIRCIELGAADYLPKPFKPALLQARLHTCMAEKRLRDLELEYLEQAGKVADAAQAVEAGAFDPNSLNNVAVREDALGRLARVFQRMAREVYLREQRLQRQLERLRLDMEETRRGRAEPATVWLPQDRQHAMARSDTLPDRALGSALFADISGFTPLTAALTREMGLRRGAEELTRTINQVYGAIVSELHRHRGSVIGFAGDSITCWLDGDDGQQALACALAMQEAMGLCSSVTTPAGAIFPLSVKVAVVAGPVRRLLVGNPDVQVIEVIAGHTVDRLAAAEHCAGRGEVVAGSEIIERLDGQADVAEWRTDARGDRVALVSRLNRTVVPDPWPTLSPEALPAQACRPWMLPVVEQRIREGGTDFLADLRPVVALFLNFRGIDYDRDEDAGAKLDAYIRWVQSVASEFGGAMLQVTMGDKGSYTSIAFGAPVSHRDDELRAIRAAYSLRDVPPELSFITGNHIGIAAGLARAGSYGSTTCRTYGIQGDRVNLAARLMQAAPPDTVLCDESVVRAAAGEIQFEALPPITVKGRTEPVSIYRPVGERWVERAPEISEAAGRLEATRSLGDRLEALLPSEHLVLKVASVLPNQFSPDLLSAILPVDSERPRLAERLAALERHGFLERHWPDELYSISDSETQEAAYSSMLFVQRRVLHREVAEWYEQNHATRLGPYYLVLAHHWRAADEPAKAVSYLEKAAHQARQEGRYSEAENLLQQVVQLETETGVLSAEFYEQRASTAPPGPGERRLGGRQDSVEGGPDYDGAMRYALSRLEHELPPSLKYHSPWHTREDVLPAVRRLTLMAGLGEEERKLIEIGAVYHDLGFLIDPKDHERCSANMASQVLPGFGFSSEQVAAIQGMILATRLPQSPKTPLEDFVADADLDNLGRDDFLARSDALRAENAALGREYTDEEWNTRQLKFLLNHTYFTEAARSLRDAGKQKNVAGLQALLASHKQHSGGRQAHLAAE